MAITEEHVWMGAGGDPGSAGQCRVPPGPLLFHPGGVLEAPGDGGGDREAHFAANRGHCWLGCQRHWPLHVPQSSAR